VPCPSPNPGAETRKEIQQIQKRITEINAEYANLMAKRATDGETVQSISTSSGTVWTQSPEGAAFEGARGQKSKQRPPDAATIGSTVRLTGQIVDSGQTVALDHPEVGSLVPGHANCF
jgi:hypothetical protein